MTVPPKMEQQQAWIDACGDGPLFQELLSACLAGKSVEKTLADFLPTIRRTQRNFYKWMRMYPEAKGLISAKLETVGTGVALLTFRVNHKRETRGRKNK